MKRLINNDLVVWRNNKRKKPLIIRGARQVGKTYTIENFGKKYFKNCIRVDFERNPQFRKIFDSDLDTARLCRDIEIIKRTKIQAGTTLLFFDEIQECPNAIQSLRYFYEEMPDLHIIAAGSLLEFALGSFSFPVGRVQLLNMFPMTFTEFLEGTGQSEAAAVIQKPSELSDVIHQHLLKQLHTYFFVGGMPECVLTYNETTSIKEAQNIQQQIIDTYRIDFPKYTPRIDQHCLDTVFMALATKVGSQIKYANLTNSYSNPTIKKSVDLLQLARIVHKVYSVNPPQLPLGASVSNKIFKNLFLDIGLMQNLAGIPVDTEYLNEDLLGLYRGALAEQFVGQEMLAANNNELYYWNRLAKNSLAEIDFLTINMGNVIPIEVKSGKAGHLRSMHSFLNTYKKTPYGVVLSNRSYSELPEQKLKFLPIYFAGSVHKLISIQT